MKYDIKELIKRAQKKNTYDEWLQLEKDMQEFLDGDYPENEKKMLSPLGWLESVTIICDGIRRKQEEN